MVGHAARVVRNTVAAVCLLSMVGVPTAAFAEPPAHAPAHGHSSRGQGNSRTLSSTQSSDTIAAGETGKATSKDGSPTRSADAHKGQGKGVRSAEHPGKGHAKGRPDTSAREEQAAPTTVSDPEPASAPEPPPPSPVAQPAPEAAAPAAAAPAPADAPATASAPPPAVSAPAVAAPAAPVADPAPAPPPLVSLGQIGQNVADAIEGVAGRVGDLRVPALGPVVTEPIANLVPLLLALLGAFLALQRGIGRGLGHVPMVVTTSHRRDVNASI